MALAPAGESGLILSMLSARPGDRRLALGVVLLSLALFLPAALFAKVPLTPVPAFLPFYQSALSINDAITALLLLSQARVADSRALLVLDVARDLVQNAIDNSRDIMVETSFFRIAQEAINNLAKHANAKKVDISLYEEDQEVRLTISDDGSGFDVPWMPEAGRYGFQIMRERAGAVDARLEVESAPGHGTRIIAILERTA